MRAEVECVLNRQAVKGDEYRIVPVLLAGVTPEDLPELLGRFQAICLPDESDWIDAEFVEEVRSHLHAEEQDDVGETECPFPGLEAFDESHARFFFGRSAEISEAIERLGTTPNGHRRWLQIEGPSGSGKSSLARAGVIPRVRRGLVTDAPRSWQVALFRPGADPVRNMAQALVEAFDRPDLMIHQVIETLRFDDHGLTNLVRQYTPKEHALLVVVDQIEEAFTLAAGRTDALVLLDGLLATALEDVDVPSYLVTSIRSDFVGHFSGLPRLEGILNERASRYHLRSMAEDGLREAVYSPTRQARLTWDTGLPERIVADAKEAEGGLPLVGHVLRALWEQRERNRLTLNAYDALGGVGGALTQSADSLIKQLGEEGRDRARRLLLGLVRIGRGSDDTRRSVSREEALAAAGGDDEAERVLARLSGGRGPDAPADAPAPPRLVVASDEHVEIAHEALIRHWSTFRGWVDDHRKALECRDDVEAAAQAWDSAGRTEDGLPRGGQLAYYADAESLNPLAADFVEEARAWEDRRTQEAQRRARKRFVAMSGTSLVLLVAFVVAMWQYRQAEESRVETERVMEDLHGTRATSFADDGATSTGAAAAGLRATIPALRRGESMSSENRLALWTAADALQRSVPLEAAEGRPDRFYGDRGRPFLSADGRLACEMSRQTGAAAPVWDALTGGIVRLVPGLVHQNQLSDGGMTAMVVEDRTMGLLDLMTGDYRWRATLSADTDPSAAPVEFRFAAGDSIVLAWGGMDTIIWVLDALSGRVLQSLRPGGQASDPSCSPGGELVVATVGSMIVVWDATSGKQRLALPAEGMSHPRFMPDGRYLFAEGSRAVGMWDTHTGDHVFTHSHHGQVRNAPAVSVGPDGENLIVISWRTSESRDGAVARAVAARDGSTTWYAELQRPRDIWFRDYDAHLVAKYSPAMGPAGARAHLFNYVVWDASTGDSVGAVTRPGETLAGIAPAYGPYAGDMYVVTANRPMGAARRFTSVQTGAQIDLEGRLFGRWAHWNDRQSDPDGRYVARMEDYQRTDRVVSPTAARLVVWGDSLVIRKAAWSRDGSKIATSDLDGSLRIWNANSRALIRSVAVDTFANLIGWSPNGSRIAAVTTDGVGEWSSEDGRCLSYAVLGDAYQAPSAGSYSPTGARIAISAGLAGGDLPDSWSTGAMLLELDCATGILSHRDREVWGSRIEDIWSHDGEYSALATPAGVMVWETSSGSLTDSIPYPPGFYRPAASTRSSGGSWFPAISWSPDGRHIAVLSTGPAGKVAHAVVLDIQTRAPACPMIEIARASGIGIAKWSPRGDRLVLGAGSQLRVLDPATWSISADSLETRGGIDSHAGAVHWSPTSRLFAIANEAGSLLRDATSGNVVGAFPGDEVMGFSPNGKSILAVGAGAAKVFGVDLHSRITRVCEILRHQPEWEEIRELCEWYADNPVDY